VAVRIDEQKRDFLAELTRAAGEPDAAIAARVFDWADENGMRHHFAGTQCSW
jgi:hypothetical protein